MRKAKLAVFVSGGGSNMKNIHTSCKQGIINADIAVVVSDKPTCGGMEYAKDNNIPCIQYPGGDLSKNEVIEKLIGIGNDTKSDYIILAGYLKLVPKEFVKIYERRMLNIHPSLLPKYGGKGYYGERVHRAVLESGDRVTGVTVHFVNEKLDEGHIVLQKEVPVYITDTIKELSERVQKEEHNVYKEAISALVDHRITWTEEGCCEVVAKTFRV
jgi:phosphoribosylglycinamide formyltransferase